MNKRFWDNLDKTNALVGLAVFATALIVYLLTKSPTVSLWDCGEFVAASAILGIPHPPGTPLFVIIGRLFSLLPLSGDVAARVTFISVICSSFTALFGYLVAVRMLRTWFGEDKSAYGRFLMYAGAASGALFLAWGFTNWSNSVEAEVYGMSMMLMMGMLWLCMIFLEKRETAQGEGLMSLVVYLAFLGIAVHMTTFLVAPVAALFFMFKKDAGSSVWYAASIFVLFEFYLIVATASRPGEIPYYVPVVIVFIFYLLYVFSVERTPSPYLWAGAGFLLSVAPMYAHGINSLAARLGADEWIGPQGLAVFDTIGKVSFGLLVLGGVYLAFKYGMSRRRGSEAGGYLGPALFVPAAAVMTLLLLIPKGYVAFAVVSVVAVIGLGFYLRRVIHWPILIAMAAGSLVTISMRTFAAGLLVGALVIVVLGLAFRVPRWRSGLLIIVMAVLGFSVHLFIPIRSAQQPAINENNPSQGLVATVNFLERKQYGSESMIERMFVRRAEWLNQFGDFQRMGFWRFFSEQYGVRGPRFVLLFLVGVFGVWEVIRRRPQVGLPFALLLLISSVGLVLYMNFADGTRENFAIGRDYIEVRDRDYFFTPAFILFGLAIGIGLGLMIQHVRELTGRFAALPRKVILTALPVVLLLPTFALARNYYQCDRSRNYFAYDYAWNLLNSADQDAVLFTYGDNDTFPLWGLQEALGVRRDVKIVNLTLCNGRWYVKQLHHSMGLDLGWTDTDIDRLQPYRSRDGAVFNIQDMTLDAVIANNIDKRPINFSVTVGSAYRKFQGRPLDPRLELCGMMWRLKDSGDKISVNAEQSWEFFTAPAKFRYRGLDDPGVYKDEATIRLAANYANGMLMTADELERKGDLARAEQLARQSLRLLPQVDAAYKSLASILSRQGRLDDLRRLVDTVQSGDRAWLATILARAEFKQGDSLRAERLLNGVLVANPSFRPALEDLMRYYFKMNDVYNMKVLLQRWMRFNPDDENIRMMLMELQRGLTGDVSGGKKQ
jgi:hypothetical protein